MYAVNDLSKIENSISQKNDYDKDGFLVCGVCHQRKEKEFEVATWIKPDGIWRLTVPCDCEKERIAQNEERQKKMEFRHNFERLQRDGITDSEYLKYNFTKDDGRNPEVTKVCQRYVERFSEMKKENIGILFYGTVGTGKSFLACCIANKLTIFLEF